MKHLHRILIVLSLLLVIVPLSMTLAVVSHLQATVAAVETTVSVTEQKTFTDLRHLVELQQWRAQSVPGSVGALALAHVYEDMMQQLLIRAETQDL